MDEFWGKFRAPLGSIIVDAALVFAIAWWGSSQTQALADINKRVEQLEVTQYKPSPESSLRLSVLESKYDRAEQDRKEILEILRRLEDKIDRELKRP